MEASVREAVTRVLGDTVWRAVGFYFDPKQASSNPEAFSAVLDKLFGPSGKVIRNVITETLLKKVGGTVGQRQSGDREFYDWVRIAKAKFSTFNSVPVAR